MCGICGEITFDGSPASLDGLQRMMNTMVPRGPEAPTPAVPSHVGTSASAIVV